MVTRELKRDTLGAVRLVDEGGHADRRARHARRPARPALARPPTRRARSRPLRAAAGLAPGVPRSVSFDGKVLRRSVPGGRAAVRGPAAVARLLRACAAARARATPRRRHAQRSREGGELAARTRRRPGSRRLPARRPFAAARPLVSLSRPRGPAAPAEAQADLSPRGLDRAPAPDARDTRRGPRGSGAPGGSLAYRAVTRGVLGWDERRGPAERRR